MTETFREQQSVAAAPGREALIESINKDIKRLKIFSNRGLFAMSSFLLLSMMAWNNFSFLPLPENVIASLGAPPPAHYISYLLLLYTFSAIILSLSRLTGNIEHKSSFCHVGYIAGFYLFYHYANALDDNFWAVFGAGITILGVESYRIWSFCSEAIKVKYDQLEHVKKYGRMPVEE